MRGDDDAAPPAYSDEDGTYANLQRDVKQPVVMNPEGTSSSRAAPSSAPAPAPAPVVPAPVVTGSVPVDPGSVDQSDLHAARMEEVLASVEGSVGYNTQVSRATYVVPMLNDLRHRTGFLALHAALDAARHEDACRRAH